MGNKFSKQNIVQKRLPIQIKTPFKRKTKYRKVLILGLDAAGKTSLLYRLKSGESINTIPTIGYNHEEVTYKGTTFSFWDIGGQFRIRTLWHTYFYNVHGIIFLVDCDDRERADEAKDLLQEVVMLAQTTGNENAVFIILANKQDSPKAMDSEELYVALELNKLIGTRFHVMHCSVRKDTGMEETLEWLHREINRKFV